MSEYDMTMGFLLLILAGQHDDRGHQGWATLFYLGAAAHITAAVVGGL